MTDRKSQKPEVRVLDTAHPDPVDIAAAVRVLQDGGLVAFPTETVYGLGARGLDRSAVAKVFEAKGRPRSHPLILHVLGEDEARSLAVGWNERATRLAQAFWPGPLTLVVGRAEHVPAEVAGGGESIALRAPVHPIARALIARLGEPIAAPSANRYQTISPTTAAHVVKSLGAAVDLVLDGGACIGGIESTVIDVRGPRTRLLRPGGIDLPTLRAVVGAIDVATPSTADAAGDAPRPSPGMDARHYAPRGRVILATGMNEVERIAIAHRESGRDVAIVAYSAPTPATPPLRVHTLPHDPKGYERALFTTLHLCDDEGTHVIVVESPPHDDERWLAVHDRLRRAAST
ncbi:L-threonylcarbamoyladenylate synthase [Pendulispora albinea]|uniref:Threonylcarbamoyl-AMP synthase n=1 Tax=Pendulispora albinea TaxID=2741071 RepID=A0ABZ2LX59_9BACT